MDSKRSFWLHVGPLANLRVDKQVQTDTQSEQAQNFYDPKPKAAKTAPSHPSLCAL